VKLLLLSGISPVDNWFAASQDLRRQ